MTDLHFFRVLPVLALSSFLALSASGGQITESTTTGALVTQSAVNSGAYGEFQSIQIGGLMYGDIGSMVESFPLPYLAPGQQITGANLSFYTVGSAGPVAFNGQLYGLTRVSTTNPAALVSDYYAGSNDTANTLLNSTLITPQTAMNQTINYSGSNLLSFVQKQYTNGAFSGQDLSSSRYIFFRVSPDRTPSSGMQYYMLGDSLNPVRTQHPTLTLTISGGITATAGRLQFSFTLPTAATTSAGVYNSAGTLIRTLWNNVQYQAGVNYGAWNGLDDNGNAMATGSSYQIKLIYHNVQYVFEGTIGNTSANQSGALVYRSMIEMQDMSIAAGRAYYAIGYNEHGSPINYFNVGTPQVPNALRANFDDTFSALTLVAADATRSYWAKGFGGYLGYDTYVMSVNNDGSFYTFPKGTAPTGSNQYYPSCVDFDATANQPNPATGLAVQLTGNELFVSHANLNQVRVFDKVQGNSLGTISVPSPQRLAVTANGDVWVISSGTSPKVLRYTFANGTATLKETITGLVKPVGLGVSADDSTLIVADGGTSEQIKAFNNSTGAALWTYGLAGGMAGNGAALTSNCFAFEDSGSGQNYISFQADNTFWVGDCGNCRQMHYSLNGNTPIYIEQISYVQTSYQATVDETDATRVFNGFKEYSVNYAVAPGGTNGSWTAVRNWQYSLTNDANHSYVGFCNGWISVVTLPNGRTYGILNNFANSKWDLYELPSSGPARNTGMEFTNNSRIYEDGSLRFNIITSTSMTFYSAPLTGFDAAGNPKWGSPSMLGTTTLAATDPHPWNAYPHRTEMTASGILVAFDASPTDSGFHLAGLPAGSTSWAWRSSPSTATSNSGWFPQDGKFDDGNSVIYAGNYDMALGRNIIYGYHGEGWKSSEASQWVNFFDDGLMVGVFGVPGVESNGVTTNGFAGNSFASMLVHAANGKVYLYSNDESNHGGSIRWRIDGWDGIVEMKASSTIGSTANLSGTSGATVMLTSPTSGQSFFNQTSVLLSANAASGAPITSVQFFDGGTSLGSVSVAPFNLNASLSVGSHTLTAKVTDNTGATATSASVTINVAGDGANTPAPTPTSLTSGAVGSNSVALAWTQPAVSTTSSTIGRVLSFQIDSTTDSMALKPTQVAGAAGYAAANFYITGQTSGSIPLLINPLDSTGTTIPNLGFNIAYSGGADTSSIATVSGTAKNLFWGEANTFANGTIIGFTLTNIPFANYDLVVYSMPEGVVANAGAKTCSVSVSGGNGTCTIQQSFTTPQTGYSVANLVAGANQSVTNMNTLAFQGYDCQSLELQGNNLDAVQIVERPYDQGVPTSYSIERAAGTSGNFAAIGTVSGSTLSYTDSSASSATTYQYRVRAINSYGNSGYSNTVSVTTTAATAGSSSGGFSSWQSKYFTAAQLADPTISGAAADPYGSGVKNLMAYALQLNPATAQPSNVPQMVLNGGHATLTYLVPTTITDITYTVEVSPDLVNWNSGSGYTQVLSSVTSAAGQTITVEDLSTTSTSTKRFIRLNVTQH